MTPLKIALKKSVYWLFSCPIKVQKKFPGNIGEGTKRDAAVNIEKNTIRISIPLIANSPMLRPIFVLSTHY